MLRLHRPTALTLTRRAAATLAARSSRPLPPTVPPRPPRLGALLAVGGGAGLAATLLRQAGVNNAALSTAAVAQCDQGERQHENLVRSIETISAAEGRVRTLCRIVYRCFELAFLLAPCLLSLPLLKVQALSMRQRWLRLLVRTLERCGPVGIKWGQWASTRYDIFEDDLCDALGALTNAAPVHAAAWTAEVVRAELQSSVGELFEGFSEEPIASGSIGQVHLAALKSSHGDHFPAGTRVAVKVQHPQLAERLGIDMAILMKTAELLDSLHDGLAVNETVAQFASNFYMQLDFRDEAQNLRRFARDFSSSFWGAIVSFPRPVDALVSQHVLVESFEQGESVASYLHKSGDAPKVTQWRRDASGTRWVPAEPGLSLHANAADTDDVLIRENVAMCGVQAYLKMLMVDNFIHADLHPGNVLVRMEDVGLLGRLQRYLLIGQTGTRVPHIVFLDAGLAASFNTRIFGNVQSFFEAIINYEGAKFGHAILGLSPTQPRVKDPEAFVNEVAIKMGEMKAEKDAGMGRAGDNIRSFMASVRKHQVTLDPTVMVALMSMLVLEGWQFRLDPSTAIVNAIEEQLKRRTSVLGYLL